jgi:hypothetical protein
VEAYQEPMARAEPSHSWMVPVIVMGLLDDFGIIGRPAVGLAILWGAIVVFPGTLAAIALMLFHLVRAIYKSLIRRQILKAIIRDNDP